MTDAQKAELARDRAGAAGMSGDVMQATGVKDSLTVAAADFVAETAGKPWRFGAVGPGKGSGFAAPPDRPDRRAGI